MNEQKTLRVGDTVLVRGKVIVDPQGGKNVRVRIEGSGWSCPEYLDIVSVEKTIHVGDTVRLRADVVGEVVAVSPPGHDPVQLWVREPGKWPLSSHVASQVSRVDP